MTKLSPLEIRNVTGSHALFSQKVARTLNETLAALPRASTGAVTVMQRNATSAASIIAVRNIPITLNPME
uniref:Uncharacterized protein n=1 Tax=Rhizobium rhizogenes TaxID=359 RepID=A0A7S4ZSL2_RHIRH|nr:hypothetical protein pC5.7c_483 [Rhizobium rhizogenes]QCL09771.1 hypothetical protein pC5.8b_282 [Rhizobium rhizogenes]